MEPSRRAALAGICATLVPLRPAGAQDNAATGEPHHVLRAAPSPRAFPGSEEPVGLWTLDGRIAPVLKGKAGAELRVRLVNDTPAPLSLHWHGVRGPNAADGVGGLTQSPVAPGSTFDYRLTPPDSGTFLVRPIVLGRSGEPAGRGLGALLVVEEADPPRVHADAALMIRDWRLDAAGALAPFGEVLEAAVAGRLGGKLTVGESDAPSRMEAPAGSRIRLRLANGCNARILRLRFDNLKVVVAAVDGQPAETFEPLRSSLPFPPGTRYDVLAEAPAEAGQTGSVTAMLGEGLPLLQVTATAAVAGAAAGAPGLPRNRLLPEEIRLQNALRRELPIRGGAVRGPDGKPVFTGDPKAVWTIGGAAGALGSPPLFTAKRGQPVVLGLHNETPFPQPLHLHGHAFRLLHNLDDGWEPYWLDTVQVAEGKTSRIAFVADNPGRWLLGSTVLERLDTGLWTWFEVT